MTTDATRRRADFRLPDLGEGLTEAEILRWLVAPGDRVEVNQPLVEVETAKAAVEIPSPVAGLVRALGAAEGEVLPVGSVLVSFEAQGGPPEVPEPNLGPQPDPASPSEPAEPRQAVLVGYGPRDAAPGRRRRRAPSVPVQVGSRSQVLAKPPVRKLARDLGLDLARIPGTGPAGVVTRADVEAFRNRPADASEQRIPIRSLRRATAEAMLRSVAVPQASVELTVDVSPILQLRDRLRADAAEPARPSFLTFVARAVVLALAERPMLHARWDEEHHEIVVPSAVSLGIAVASPRGLLVPKVRDAGGRSLAGLGAEIGRLAEAARAGTLEPGELTGGTFTLSNVGVFGVDGATSLLTPGETGILCVGAVRERPWVEDGTLVVRRVVSLTLTIDHRVVDGEAAAGFLADVGALLHDPGLMLARS